MRATNETGTLNDAAPSAENLRRLVLLRYVIVAVLAAAIGVAELWLHLHPALAPSLAGLALLLSVNVAVHLRLRSAWPVTRAEFLANLLADVVLLSAFLHFTGGPTNPLVSLLLLPLIVAAATLSQPQVWTVAAAGIGAYTSLLFFHQPLERHVHHAHGVEAARSVFDLHLAGMWLTFVLSAALVPFFLSRMAQSLRARDRALAAAREEVLRSERIVALGTLAAGAAHELGTPLGNVLLLADEIGRRFPADAGAQEDLGELRAQVRNCKRILGEMVAAAGETRAESGRLIAADDFVDEVLTKWQLMRPALPFQTRWLGERPAPELVAELTLVQALINLLNNAADAGGGAPIGVDAECAGGRLRITIADRGPGIPPEIRERAGVAFIESSGSGGGLGIGLFLANATIERAGGEVRLLPRPGGGTRTVVTLPLGGGQPVAR